jgi:hypothetical protein
MGRIAKRVPMDFDWPLKKVWEGYLMPDRLREDECAACGGDGLTREARAVADTFYPHQIEWGNTAKANALAWHDKIGQAEVDYLVKKGRLRTWVPGEGGEGGSWHSVPRTAGEVNAANQRNGIDCHDTLNRHLLVKFRCKRLGIPLRCATCKGHGTTEKYEGQRAEAEAWEPTEPPIGDGWQMWETTSEGSPTSPVFATAEELAEWCEGNATVFADHRATSAEWLAIITGDDFAHVQIAPGVIVM